MEAEKIKNLKEGYQAISLVSFFGGVALGSLLTAYCWTPSNMEITDSNKDGKQDIVVQQMSGVKRVYLGQSDGSYDLDTSSIDNLLEIFP